jgi:hypothetical protein
MGWTGAQVDIENFSIVGASFGGPLAIIRDDKKFLKVTQNVPVKPIINIYTSSGTLVSSIKVRKKKHFKIMSLINFAYLILVGLWNPCENGLVILRRLSVRSRRRKRVDLRPFREVEGNCQMSYWICN